MSPTLIVPVNVAALAVGDAETSQVLGPMANFSALDQARVYLGAVAFDQSTPFEGQIPPLQGIHLHWALPDGLTAGQASPTGSIAFPCAPNRWLVTRMVVCPQGGQPATEQVTSWVVESDSLAEQESLLVSQPQVPLPLPGPGLSYPTTKGQSYEYLGATFDDVATWREPGGADVLTPLTAMGHGEPTFAAFYPNCSSVFGFHDPMTSAGLPSEFDPSTSTISYHVAGWYGPSGRDPLADGAVAPSTLGWSVAGDAADAAVCAGAIDAIVWNPSTTYLDDQPASMQVALAPSPQEAVSALLAQVDGQDGVEQVLNALQFGLLSGSSNTVTSPAALEEAVHAAGFAAVSAGQLWTVVQAATEQGGGSAASPQGGEVTLADAEAEALNALNVAQLELNDLQAQLQALQYQLFADWCKAEVCLEQLGWVPLPTSDLSYQSVQTYLDGEITAIDGLQSAILAQKTKVSRKQTALMDMLDASLTLTNTVEAPRYYQPADPVVLLSGDDVVATDRYGNDGASSPDGMLACRLDSDVLSAVTLEAGFVTGSEAVTLQASALPAVVPQAEQAPAALLQALVQEAFLLCYGLQPAVAAAVAQQGGDENPAVADLADTVTNLQAAATNLLAGEAPANATYTGTAPDPIYYDVWGGTFDHPEDGTPWLPIILQYNVTLIPVGWLDPAQEGDDAYPPGFVDANFAFDSPLDEDPVDLVYQGSAPANANFQAYVGTAILTPSATIPLAGEINTYIANVGTDPELSTILTDLNEASLLSQCLTGFTESLLMREQMLQMPVGDPYTDYFTQLAIASVATAVGGQNATSPLPNFCFNPIRAGGFSIEKLRLIDVFGRFKDYVPGKDDVVVVVAQSLQPPSALPGAVQAFLPPRITQPARLLLRWRAADDGDVESNASPATTPVLGWVVPNYLDNAIALYDTAGDALGVLSLSGNKAKVLFTPAPGGAHEIGTPLKTVFTGANADLRHFAEGLFNADPSSSSPGDASFFGPFFDAVREALTFSLPDKFRENAAQAVLLGQPLALVRANLALDLAGPAATNQSWPGFAAAVNGTPPTDPLAAVELPVTLGALTQLDDTLVGYWIDPENAADYRTFYAPYATEAQGGVNVPVQDTLTLTTQDVSAGGTDVVMLLDPRGCVHATTGILPVEEVDIPSTQYAATLAALTVTFETTPVLSGSNVPATDGGPPPMVMLQPSVASGAWSWVIDHESSWTQTPLVDEPTAQATLSYSPQRISEGWLSLSFAPPPPPS